jgi:hypothetical protein
MWISRRWCWIAAALAGIAACGGKVVLDEGASGATSGSGGSSGDSGGTGGGAGVECNAGHFPTFSKACAADSDCVVEIHRTNCCGSTVAIGVSASAGAAFEVAEKACDAMYPACNCFGMGPVAEDGKLGTLGHIDVSCQMGKCMTFVP